MAGTKKVKKALLIASMASMLDNFNRDNIDTLLSLGYELTLASNFHTNQDSNSQEKTERFLRDMKEKGAKCVQIDFSRGLFDIKGQWKSYQQVKKLLKQKFDLIHCHSPICAAITRLCARKYRKTGTRVVYTAHGFHFFKNAPMKNWLIYYPVEKMMSRFTDVLITINKEDYYRAKYKFHAKKTVYIPGVGIDCNRFQNLGISREQKRQELGLSKEDIFILSVGELNKNKNHEVVVRALAGLKGQNIVYMIAGEGNQKEHLKTLAEENGVSLRLLGFREDICPLLEAADVFAFPSKREGLSVSVMEAMFMKKPVIASKIRGNTDLIKDGENGLLVYPNMVDSWKQSIRKMLGSLKTYNVGDAKKLALYEKNNIIQTMKQIYSDRV
mgnify:FL=1